MECVHLFPRLDGACRYSECTQATGQDSGRLTFLHVRHWRFLPALLSWGARLQAGRAQREALVWCPVPWEQKLPFAGKAAWEVRRSAEAVMVALVQETNQSQGLDMPSAFPPSARRFYISVC